MKRATSLFAALFCAAFVFAPSSRADFETDCAGFNPKPLAKKTVVITNGKKRLKINAEIARTDSEKTRGLMCGKNLRDGFGMLFVFDRAQKSGFWMFNTYFDLDILYIARDGRVIGKTEMKKCPRGAGENLQQWQKRCLAESRAYLPPAPYSAALELPAGWLKRKGFHPGEKILVKWKP